MVVDRLQCNGESQCALTPLTGEKDQGIALWTGRILVRAAVFGGTRFECQVFKAPTIDQVSGTLRSLDDASTVDLDAPLPSAGAVALFSAGAIAIESLDVLRSTGG